MFNKTICVNRISENQIKIIKKKINIKLQFILMRHRNFPQPQTSIILNQKIIFQRIMIMARYELVDCD